MTFLAFIQDHAAPAAAEGGAAHGGHHTPAIVEWINHTLGPAAFDIQAQVMPPLYSLFGAHWPGEGMTFEQYMEAGQYPIPSHVVMFLIAVIVSVVVLYFLRGKLSTEKPTTRQQTFEVGVETIRSLLSELIGPHGLKHFPIIATFATLILISNMLGLVPGLLPPTANLNVTLALAVVSFLYYNWIGIRENGLFGHLKHFAGPIPALAVLMFPIEIISNLARILSLSLRLFGNIYGEEQVSGVIGQLLPWIVPMAMYPLSILAIFLQTFIFIVLSMIYIGEVSHGDDHHGGHGEPAAAH